MDGSLSASDPDRTPPHFKGIAEALAYLGSLGLTRALVLVRPGTYVESAGTTDSPDSVVLFGAADPTAETTTWDPKLHSFSGTVNITAYNMGFRAPGTVGAGPTWNSLTAMGCKFETAGSGQARTWATYVRADNCLFESFCTMGGLVQITNSEVFFNVAQTVTLAQQLVMRNVRFAGSSSCTLNVGADIADLDVHCVSTGQQGTGFPSLTVSCGSGATLVCNNAAQDDQAGISVTAAAGHNGVYLKGVFTNGTIGAGTEFSHLNARFRGFLDVTGPATLQVILRTVGDIHFVRGRNVGGTIAFTDATISSGTLLSIFSDGTILSCATDGVGVSGTARPVAFDAGATDNFILFPNIDAWPVAVAGLGATNRVETTPSPYASAVETILKSIVDAKGDLIVATAADTVARKAVGADGTFLVADSGQSDGLNWVDHAGDADPHIGYQKESEKDANGGYVGRDGSGHASLSGQIRATGGLGVGNSAAATTPGTVVKKIEVFDASGVSLGFVPVYDAIT